MTDFKSPLNHEAYWHSHCISQPNVFYRVVVRIKWGMLEKFFRAVIASGRPTQKSVKARKNNPEIVWLLCRQKEGTSKNTQEAKEEQRSGLQKQNEVVEKNTAPLYFKRGSRVRELPVSKGYRKCINLFYSAEYIPTPFSPSSWMCSTAIINQLNSKSARSFIPFKWKEVELHSPPVPFVVTDVLLRLDFSSLELPGVSLLPTRLWGLARSCISIDLLERRKRTILLLYYLHYESMRRLFWISHETYSQN